MSDPTIPDWINAGAAAIGALAVVLGLLGARSKFDEASRNARKLRRSEVAEELIALTHNAEDAFRHVRSPFDSIPIEKAKDKVFPYQRRFDTLASYSDLFKSLRDAQIRVRAVIGDEEVDQAVESIFQARGGVASAIEILADLANEEPHASERELKKKLRARLYGSFDERDELGQQVLEAVKLVDRKLSPVARLE